MARYTNEDQRNLEELLEEGLWNRMKAHGAQAVGAVKGAGQQLKGAAQQAAGSVMQGAGNLAAKGVQAVGGQIDPSQNKLTQAGQDLQKSGTENVQAGGNQAQNAKIDSYINSVGNKVNDMLQDITNDLNKLGFVIPPQKKGLIGGSANAIISQLTKALQSLKQ